MQMRFMKDRGVRRLRAAVVGAAVIAAGLVFGHSAQAVDTSFTQSCASNGPLSIQTVGATNDANNVTFTATMCNNFNASDVSRIVWQLSFSDTGQSSVPVDNCLMVEPSAYTASGLNGYILDHCAGNTVSGGGAVDAGSGALVGTGAVTHDDGTKDLSVLVPITTLRAAGLGGANNFEFRVVARDTVAGNLNNQVPQDAAPESSSSFLNEQLNVPLLTAPALAINSAKKVLSAGVATMNFTVTLTPASSRTVTVNFTAADGTAHTPRDYTVTTASPLTFNPGDTSKTIAVHVKHGARGVHTFTITLSNAVNAVLSTPTGTGTIVDR